MTARSAGAGVPSVLALCLLHVLLTGIMIDRTATFLGYATWGGRSMYAFESVFHGCLLIYLLARSLALPVVVY